MSNDSSTGGPLSPTASPTPLEGQALLRFFHDLVAGITGLDKTMIRPRWQAEPANIPTAGTAWAAIGITRQSADTYPYVKHDPAGQGSDVLQRQEQIELQCSFYDTGVDGQAMAYASLLRDGLAIAQNREPLTQAGMGLVSVGDLTPAPVLVKARWLFRVDVPVVVNRQIDRVFQVLNLESASGTVITDVGITRHFSA